MSSLSQPEISSSTAPIPPVQLVSTRPTTDKRSVAKLLEPLNRIADTSRHLISKSMGQFESRGQRYSLPRYLYVGPRGGGDILRIGIFATLHGDEPEGALALGKLLARLDQKPELAQGFALFIYPVCNPTGFEDNTRHARTGVDLNREFWKQSSQPEVRFLESEIWMQAFHGIVTLHSDDTSDGLYGFVKGAVLSENLLEPALIEASRFLPRNERPIIDGFNARSGVISDGYQGMLQSAPGLPQPPFEITLETPQRAPLHRQVDALVAAIETILVEFRYLQAIAKNI